MKLKEKIINWKENPDALGAEAKVAVIIGELAVMLGEEIPDNVNLALKILSLHEAQKNESDIVKSSTSETSSSLMSWTEALSVITIYLEESIMQFESLSYLEDDEKRIQIPTSEEHAYHQGWQEYRKSGKKNSPYHSSSTLFKFYMDGWESAERGVKIRSRVSKN